jgi:glycosyl transferase family 25
MFDFIEKVIYINLEHRKDRREHIEKQLLCFPSEKIIRLDAIYEKEKGHIGCSKSHVAALKLAIENSWKNCLILEDDAVWNKFELGSICLEKLSQNNFDVIMLGGTAVEYDKTTSKLFKCCCATAYLVNQHYYEKLLMVFNESIKRLEIDYNPGMSAIDQVWHHLQKNDNWYIIIPCLMTQIKNYSDIEKSITEKLYAIL